LFSIDGQAAVVNRVHRLTSVGETPYAKPNLDMAHKSFAKYLR